METDEIRLECLRLAVEFGSARTVSDPVELATRYFDFMRKPEDKLNAPRRKPMSKVD
tara:strand:- start:63 stop:233 length:171 start_codon:yes stop_codon:yes gene_type:complete